MSKRQALNEARGRWGSAARVGFRRGFPLPYRVGVSFYGFGLLNYGLGRTWAGAFDEAEKRGYSAAVLPGCAGSDHA